MRQEDVWVTCVFCVSMEVEVGVYIFARLLKHRRVVD